MIVIGAAGFMQAQKAQAEQIKPICENCVNWKHKGNWRGTCSEKFADKVSKTTVADYSCRYFSAPEGGDK